MLCALGVGADPVVVTCAGRTRGIVGVLGHAEVFDVAGGQAVLRAAGAAVESSPQMPSRKAAIDVLFFVPDCHDGNLEASRR